MKKLLSVLLAVSIMATPLVSRVGFAEEILYQEAEKEQSWFQKFLNETKKAGNAGWLYTKEFVSIASKGSAWIYELVAAYPKFSINTGLQIYIIYLLRNFIRMSRLTCRDAIQLLSEIDVGRAYKPMYDMILKEINKAKE